MFRKVALLVEGDGDVKSMPLLFRNCANHLQLYNLTLSHMPIKVGDPIGACNGARFIKLFTYAIGLKDTDAVLVCLDCDDDCSIKISKLIHARIRELATSFDKPAAICLFNREYESMFLANISILAQSRSDISCGVFQDTDWHKYRDAKGKFSSMLLGLSYKETRDQEKYTAAIDIESTRKKYPALDHFLNSIAWLNAGIQDGKVLYCD